MLEHAVGGAADHEIVPRPVTVGTEDDDIGFQPFRGGQNLCDRETMLAHRVNLEPAERRTLLQAVQMAAADMLEFGTQLQRLTDQRRQIRDDRGWLHHVEQDQSAVGQTVQPSSLGDDGAAYLRKIDGNEDGLHIGDGVSEAGFSGALTHTILAERAGAC